jgi:hypothetical protein
MRSHTYVVHLTLCLLLLMLTGCSTDRESDPARTATEQLLISQAADQAADQINLDIKPGTKVFVDASNFDGTDAKYAIALLRERVLRLGGALVADRGASDTVVEIRSGALSIDKSEMLVGIPHFDIPIPLAGPLGFPEIALYKKAQQQGVAKFAAVAYNTKDGRAQSMSGAQFGASHTTDWVVLIFFSWSTNDIKPDNLGDKPLDVQRPDMNEYRESSP